MRKILLFLLTTQIMAQVDISGPINQNTTWISSLSPYNVVDDALVMDGVTLTIEPGTEIVYQGSYKINVNGNIIANGTDSDRIIFKSNEEGVSSGATMLSFSNTDLSASELSYLTMKDASMAIRVEGGGLSGTLQGSQVNLLRSGLNTGSETLDWDDSEPKIVIVNGIIDDSLIKGDYPNSSGILLEDISASGSTFNSDSYNQGGIILSTSDVDASSFTLGCCDANISVYSSTITNSNFSDYNSHYSIHFENSELINCSINLPYSNNGCSVINTTISAGNGLYCKNLTLDSSTIQGNGGGIGVEFTGSASINNSQIKDYDIGIKARGGLSANNNAIYNNATFNLENLTGDTDATNNWWGTTDVSLINDKIWDFYDDINLGIVYFEPFLQENPFSDEIGDVIGCTDELACNYNIDSNTHDDSCDYSCHNSGNYSLNFNGMDDYVSLDPPFEGYQNNYSVALSFYANSYDGRMIYHNRNHDMSSYIRLTNNPENNNIELNFYVGTDAQNCPGYTTNSGYCAVDLYYPVALNQWYDVVGTYNGQIMKLYVDGNLVNSIQVIGNQYWSGPSLDGQQGYWYTRIGDNNGGGYIPIDGKVDNIIIYDIALSEDQILSLNTNLLNGNEQNIRSLYKFNAGNGNVLYDHSGNQNHGTIYGASWIDNSINQCCFESYGDINCDTIIDISDIIIMIDIILDLIDYSDDQIYCADVNGDSIVDISDLILLIDTILGF